MPTSTPQETQAGNIYFPNTFQVPNVTVDRLATLLPDSAFKILVVACRKILGYEEHRRTLRDRISRSQFCLFAGVSNSTAIFGTNILTKANILLPVGKPNQDGQEYELNLGQSGDYDWAYLDTLPRRAGNPNPAPARNAVRARRLQNELFTPNMAVRGGLTIRGGNSIDPSNEIDPGGYLDRGQGANSIETQKPKTIKGEIDTSSLDEIVFLNNLTPRQLWERAIGEMAVVIGKPTCEAYFEVLEPVLWANGCLTILVPDSTTRETIKRRFISSLLRILKAIAQQDLAIYLMLAEGDEP